MFSSYNQTKKSNNSRRVIIASILMLVIFGGYILDLASIQLVHGAEYAAMVKSVNTYQSVVEGARGDILDRHGKPLVKNRQGYSIIFDRSYFPAASRQQERNEIIYSLLKLMEREEEVWIDPLPLLFDSEDKLIFAQDMETEIAYLKSPDMLNLNHYATAENCFDALIAQFSLQDYSKEDARNIASVCVSMHHMGFSMSQTYTFAEDVKIDTVSKIKENNELFKGVDVKIVTYREYTDGTLAVHLLGNVGAISANEYKREKEKLEAALVDEGLSENEKETLKVNEYKLDASMGKFGIEQAMEGYLRGKNGIKTIVEDVDGEISQKYTVSPKTGNTVILSLDEELQRVTEKSLESRISQQAAELGIESAGACVVIDVNTGEVLASSSYPSYDLDTFTDDYNSLAAQDSKPLWNRALQGAYAPGSTMKPVIALAGLESGVIDADTQLYCNKIFEYKGHTFECLGNHGYLNVVDALDVSCNVFFYRVADMLGINIMNQYSTMFGLGSKTGIELPEATGVLAGIPYVNSLGIEWLPGDTVQAAIGQSYNAFTPLQLANYCAAIANGGKLFVPQLIKSVKSFDYEETLIDKEPQLAADSTFSETSLSLVRQGMRKVADTGFCREAFKDCIVNAAAKTGTSQVRRMVDGVLVEENNSFLISYAPYENPQLAVAIVVEKIVSSHLTASVAADIYDHYFGRTPELAPFQPYNQLLH